MTYLDKLKAKISEKGVVSQLTEPTKPGSVSFVSSPRGPISEKTARETLRDWHRHLSALDFDTAPDGFTLNRWRQLVDDAEWLYENHGSQLVRDGWSAHDMFGVLPWREGGGVVLDRLQGARNLKLDGEGRAFWTSYSVTFVTSRGMGDALLSSGLRLVWELSERGQSAS